MENLVHLVFFRFLESTLLDGRYLIRSAGVNGAAEILFFEKQDGEADPSKHCTEEVMRISIRDRDQDNPNKVTINIYGAGFVKIERKNGRLGLAKESVDYFETEHNALFKRYSNGNRLPKWIDLVTGLCKAVRDARKIQPV